MIFAVPFEKKERNVLKYDIFFIEKTLSLLSPLSLKKTDIS